MSLSFSVSTSSMDRPSVMVSERFFTCWQLQLKDISNQIGAMYFPNPWWATSECKEDSNPDTCEFLDGVPGDINLCQPKSKCKNDAALVDWYTNYTSVAQRTISKFNLKNPNKINVGGTGRFGPWNSPGAATIVGEGCGVQGGNPAGWSDCGFTNQGKLLPGNI